MLGALLTCALQADIPAQYKSGVLVVVNDATPPETGTGATGASQWIADHYIAVRGIPAGNVCHMNWHAAGSTDPRAYDNWSISYADYLTYVRTPIYNCIQALGAGANGIRWIVNTYGVPSHILQINSDQQVSVDSMLTLAYQSQTCPQSPGTLLRCGNTYATNYNINPRRIWNFAGLGTGSPLFDYWPLIVARLDGPSAVLASALVDKAIAAERGISKRSGIGYFDWQGGTSFPDNTMKRAYDLCVAAGFRCVLNNQSITGHLISSAPDTLWAWGWYSGPTVNDVYSFVPGAVASQLTSYTAGFIRYDGAGAYAPVWIREGITVFWGVTGEPTSNYYPLGDNVLTHLWQGYTVGEAFTMASPLLNWMQVLIGDPLYTPFLMGPTSITGSARTSGKVRLQ